MPRDQTDDHLLPNRLGSNGSFHLYSNMDLVFGARPPADKNYGNLPLYPPNLWGGSDAVAAGEGPQSPLRPHVQSSAGQLVLQIDHLLNHLHRRFSGSLARLHLLARYGVGDLIFSLAFLGRSLNEFADMRGNAANGTHDLTTEVGFRVGLRY